MKLETESGFYYKYSIVGANMFNNYYKDIGLYNVDFEYQHENIPEFYEEAEAYTEFYKLLEKENNEFDKYELTKLYYIKDIEEDEYLRDMEVVDEGICTFANEETKKIYNEGGSILD